MKLLVLLTFLFGALTSGSAIASSSFKRDDVVLLLMGNSIIGEDKGIRFVQYFAPNGQTVYERASGNIEVGRWMVNDAGEVCTRWQGNETACYKMQAGIGAIEWIGPLATNSTTVFSRTIIHPQNLTSVPMPTLNQRSRAANFGDVVAGFLEIY